VRERSSAGTGGAVDSAGKASISARDVDFVADRFLPSVAGDRRAFAAHLGNRAYRDVNRQYCPVAMMVPR
jgi:hypothetical protein